jgi:hypothetical protein
MSLNEVIFSIDGHLRDMFGFAECASLCRIEIPSSVEVIELSGFKSCTSLNEVTARGLFVIDARECRSHIERWLIGGSNETEK